MIAVRHLALLASAALQPAPASVPPVRAATNFAQIITDADYPIEAIRNGEEGTVRIIVAVGADGRVSDCRVTSSSNSPSLDEATCRITTSRAQFSPARNAAGEAVADEAELRVNWVLATEPPPVRAHLENENPFSDVEYPAEAVRTRTEGEVAFALTIGADGRVADCRVTASSGSPVLDAATCDGLRSRARFAPARNAAGNPVIDRFASFVRWVLPRAPRAGANLASYVSRSDYPSEAIRRGEQGRAAFELDVSPEGLPAGCRIVESSGSAALDARTCEIMMRRARFRPARDAAGHPVADVVRSAIRWVLP